ncbi:GMC oxidoreductase [Deminuibacter soli]|uniref:GMC family oxidoreductase n=1 Tax=Deminuibacter soli TaxID=2291815 RepID=A0A3E1NEI5_9BACT|nr:GMC family oxidoreductase [Deminuibacter soli]RFM26272.1 GMC family oxidoreductase [Deminuibacter soli]
MAFLNYDVVIVGSGVAGAQMAYQFAKNGLYVLVVEAGDVIPNVAQQYPVKQDALDKYFSAPIKDPSAPWPQPKDPNVSWADSKIYAPRPTSPGVNSNNTNGVDWKDQEGNYMQQKAAYAYGSTYERVAGGTTKHWLGTCLRFVPDDFKVMSVYKPPVPGGYDWPIGYSDLEKYYTQAEKEIGVAGDPTVDNAMGAKHSESYPMTPVPQSYLDNVLKTRLQGQTIDGNALNVVGTPQGRNTKVYDGRPACMGNSSCVPICPINAKYDAGVHVSKITSDPALSKYVTFAPRFVAVELKVGADDQISGIFCKSWDPNSGAGNGILFSAKQYVIAAHAVETAKLLLNSPWKNNKTVANSSDMVGRHLMDHICLVVWGNVKKMSGSGYEPVFPYRGPMSTSGIESFRNDPKQRPKTAAFRIEIGNDGWSWPYGGPGYNVGDLIGAARSFSIAQTYGPDLVAKLKETVQSQVRFALELETISGDETMESRVQLSSEVDAMGIPRPTVSYKLPQYTLDGYVYAQAVANQLLGKANIDNKTVLQGGPGTMKFKPTGSSQEITIEFRGAGHSIGTHRMGSDPQKSVVNKDLQSWDHSNLYLVGSGAFPSTATSNPTLTIAALALRAAETITAKIKAAVKSGSEVPA